MVKGGMERPKSSYDRQRRMLAIYNGLDGWERPYGGKHGSWRSLGALCAIRPPVAAHYIVRPCGRAANLQDRETQRPPHNRDRPRPRRSQTADQDRQDTRPRQAKTQDQDGPDRQARRSQPPPPGPPAPRPARQRSPSAPGRGGGTRPRRVSVRGLTNACSRQGKPETLGLEVTP